MYANVRPTGNCIMMTLTYHGDMSNYSKMSQDINNYHNSIRKVESSYEYLDIIEIGNHYTYHCHEIMILDHRPSLSECNMFQQLWHGKGNTRITAINKRNYEFVISYLTLYGTAPILPQYLEDTPDIWNYDSDKYCQYSKKQQWQIKHYIKNLRLFHFPSGSHIVRASKGLIKPQKAEMTRQELLNLTKGNVPMFTETISVESDCFRNMYYYEQYKLKRDLEI